MYVYTYTVNARLSPRPVDLQIEFNSRVIAMKNRRSARRKQSTHKVETDFTPVHGSNVSSRIGLIQLRGFDTLFRYLTFFFSFYLSLVSSLFPIASNPPGFARARPYSRRNEFLSIIPLVLLWRYSVLLSVCFIVIVTVIIVVVVVVTTLSSTSPPATRVQDSSPRTFYPCHISRSSKLDYKMSNPLWLLSTSSPTGYR